MHIRRLFIVHVRRILLFLKTITWTCRQATDTSSYRRGSRTIRFPNQRLNCVFGHISNLAHCIIQDRYQSLTSEVAENCIVYTQKNIILHARKTITHFILFCLSKNFLQ